MAVPPQQTAESDAKMFDCAKDVIVTQQCSLIERHSVWCHWNSALLGTVALCHGCFNVAQMPQAVTCGQHPAPSNTRLLIKNSRSKTVDRKQLITRNCRTQKPAVKCKSCRTAMPSNAEPPTATQSNATLLSSAKPRKLCCLCVADEKVGRGWQRLSEVVYPHRRRPR